MVEELQELYLRQLLEGHWNASEVVAWQAGEPILMPGRSTLTGLGSNG